MMSFLRRRRGPQPKIKVVPTAADQVVEATAALGVALSITMLVAYWHRVPVRIPTRFDYYGNATDWGSRTGLLVMCGMIFFSYLLLTVINRFPHTFNYPVPITEENADRQYTIVTRAIRWLKLELVWGYGYLLAASIRISLNPSLHLNPWFLHVFLGVIFLTLAIMLVASYKAR